MARLSDSAARLFREAHPHVHALTDITGFSLIGHAHEMASPLERGAAIQHERASTAFRSGGLRRRPASSPGAPNATVAFWRVRSPSRVGSNLGSWTFSTIRKRRVRFSRPSTRRTPGPLVAGFRTAGEPVWTVGEAVAAPQAPSKSSRDRSPPPPRSPAVRNPVERGGARGVSREESRRVAPVQSAMPAGRREDRFAAENGSTTSSGSSRALSRGGVRSPRGCWALP